MPEERTPPFTPPENHPCSAERVFDPGEEVSLRALAIIPLKRKRVVVGCTALGLLLGVVVTLTITPRYRATATIELNEDKNDGVSALSDLALAATGTGDALKVRIQTETAVIQDDSIALAVMNDRGMLRLAPGGWFSKEPGQTVSLDALPPARRDQLIQRFEGNLKVKEVENSRLIAITYTSFDPAEAADVANAVVAAYRSYLLHSNYNSSKEVSQWLTSQLSGLSDQVTKSERDVAAFEDSHNLSSSMPGLISLGAVLAPSSVSGRGGAGPGGGMRIPELDRLSTLNEEVTQAEAQRLAADAIYRLTQTQDPGVVSSLATSALPGLANSTVISQGNGLEILNALREQEAAARVNYADISTKYGAKNPRLIEVQNQLQSLQDQIRAEMDKIRQRAKNDLTLAEQNEKALRLAFEAQKSVTSKMNDDVVQLGILMEQANSSRELYDLLFAKLQEANIDSGSSAANVTIADPARPPGRPFVPQRILFPLTGLLAGLLLGAGLAYLLESQDDTLADSVQVESLAHAPVLAVIPYHRRQTRSGRDAALDAETSPFLTDRDGATAEAIRTLRSALTLSGDVVRALRFHAKAYIHGHRVGGTNPSLVESLAAGSATIAHDNRFTRWVAGEEEKFFTGPEDLEEIVCSLEKEPKLLEEMEAGSRQRFEKDLVKDRVLAAYEELLLRVSRCYRKGPPDSGAAWLPRFMRRRYTARRNRWDDGDAKE